MSVMITIEMPVIPEKLEEYLGILKQALVDTRVYIGCQSVATYVEQANSNVVLVEDGIALKISRLICLGE